MRVVKQIEKRLETMTYYVMSLGYDYEATYIEFENIRGNAWAVVKDKVDDLPLVRMKIASNCQSETEYKICIDLFYDNLTTLIKKHDM